MKLLSCLLLSSVAAFAVACGDDGTQTPTPDAPAADQPVELRFAVELGNAPFACGATVTGVGTPPVSFAATDARFYVHDVELLDDSGRADPVALTEGPFQGGGLALLDFEDGCGSDGTAATHTSLTGTVAGRAHNRVRFTLGVPPARNFIDLATAAPPLDVTGMYWIWLFGYKFLKLDGQATTGAAQAPFFLHLGASGCPGDNFEDPPPSPCAYPNSVTYELWLDPAQDVIVADLDEVLAASDLMTNTEGTAPGCMSEPADPECLTLLPRLGVNRAAEQQLFRVQ